MGKDQKDRSSITNFKTKETLKDDDVQLTRELKHLERQYQDIYHPVQRLEAAYLSCKEHFALRRYGELKAMIKSCVTDEILQRAAELSVNSHHIPAGKSKSLLTASKKFASGATEAATARDDISQLHKAEVSKDIEEKQKRKDHMERKFLRLHNRLEKLKRDYEESKMHIPTKRYLVMKEIIKPIIRDTGLRVDAQ